MTPWPAVFILYELDVDWILWEFSCGSSLSPVLVKRRFVQQLGVSALIEISDSGQRNDALFHAVLNRLCDPAGSYEVEMEGVLIPVNFAD